MPEDGLCRVAVLPFTNGSDFRDGGVLLYRVFTAELAGQQDFELSQEGDIRAAYRQVRVSPYFGRLTFDQLRIIGDYLNVDVLIVGHISEMEEKMIKGKSIPFMTISLELRDAQTGRTLSSVHHRRDGNDYLKVMHFGIVTTTTELSHLISKEIIGDLAAKGFVAQCSE